jgi:RNA polymerase sigma factor (TIGR02999 family)
VEITELLQRVHGGDKEALNSLIPLVYGELKKLASVRLRGEIQGEPLETTALVHEAYLRLTAAHHPAYENRAHFYGIASRLMRQVLVDFARSRAAGKRNGEIRLATVAAGRRPDENVLVMDQALERLAESDPLKVQLIEMRYFGGMTAEESAEALSMSVHIVRRELRLAQAWLKRELA